MEDMIMKLTIPRVLSSVFKANRKIAIVAFAFTHFLSIHAMFSPALRTSLIAAGKKRLNSKVLPSSSSAVQVSSKPIVGKYLTPISNTQENNTHKNAAFAPRRFSEGAYARQESRSTSGEQGSNDDSYSWRRRRYKFFLVGSLAAATAATYEYGTTSCQAAEQVPEAASSLRVDDGLQELNYTINLMWINRVFEPDQKYIHPSIDQHELEVNLLNTAFKWATLNPNATVCIWYDSAFITPQAVQNTQEIINTYKCACPSACVELKDVRDLPMVQAYPEIFSDKLPVFFRADLLRLIASVHLLKESNVCGCFIYADLDIKPISHAELFNSQTIKDLQEFGIIVDEEQYSPYGFENSFHILSNQNALLMQAIEQMLIELSMIRAKHALRGEVTSLYMPQSGPMKVIQESIFRAYQNMFEYYCHIAGLGVLTVRPFYSGSGKSEQYDFTKHGFEVFGVKELYEPRTEFKLEDKVLKEKASMNTKGCFVPTISVSRPLPQCYYDYALPDSERPYFSKRTMEIATITGVCVGVGAIAALIAKSIYG